MAKSDRKRIIEWEDPQKSARNAESISGLDYLKSIKDGHISPPPIAKLVGYELVEVSKGATVYTFDPKEYHYNPFFSVHGGMISTILDTTMTAAVLSALEKGVSCSTAEIKVNFVRPITVETGLLKCMGRIIHLGKRLATAEGKLKGEKGTLYAHGVSTCLIIRSG